MKGLLLVPLFALLLTHCFAQDGNATSTTTGGSSTSTSSTSGGSTSGGSTSGGSTSGGSTTGHLPIPPTPAPWFPIGPPRIRPIIFEEFEVNSTNPPSGRTDSILAEKDDRVLVIGGKSGKTNMEDIWAYNTTSEEWEKLKGKVDVIGSCHVQDGDVIYMYGGVDSSGSAINYLQKFDLGAKEWKVEKFVKADMKATGCTAANGKFYIATVNGTELIIYSHDLSNADGEWKKLEGDKDLKVTDPLLFFDNQKLVVFDVKTAVFWRYDVDREKWSKDKVTGTKKPPHLANAKLSTTGTTARLVGIVNTKDSFTHVWTYDLSTFNWTSTIPGGTWSVPSPRENVGAFLREGRMVFFGGEDGGKYSDELWQVVFERDCAVYTKCSSCVADTGCGWCKTNDIQKCIAGKGLEAYAANTCIKAKGDKLEPFLTTLDACTSDEFPGWAIALIIVAAILVIGVVWYFVMRCQKRRQDYTPLN